MPARRVLEICPYEPPASGWVTRLKLVRRVIEARGAECAILDIGPSRRLQRPECVPVMDGRDYVRKVWAFASRGFVIHGHVNGEYFRGVLLTLAALLIGRLHGTRGIVTFHAGTMQPFFAGWRRYATWGFYRLLFLLSHRVICNSEAVRAVIGRLTRGRQVDVIPAFSRQYLEFTRVALAPQLAAFLEQRSPVVTTYLCFREGFFTEVVLDAMALLVERRPSMGLVIIGTGDERERFAAALQARGLTGHVFLAGDLGRDAFMTLMAASDLHLRTPVTDGVSATVLEAMSLRVPVIASDNGTRPPGVVTYPAADAAAMAAALDDAARRREELSARLPPVHVEDTAQREADVLLGTELAWPMALDTPCRAAE